MTVRRSGVRGVRGAPARHPPAVAAAAAAVVAAAATAAVGSSAHRRSQRLPGFVRGIQGCCVVSLREDSGQQEFTVDQLPSEWQWRPRRQATSPAAAGPGGCCFHYPPAVHKEESFTSAHMHPFERIRLAAWAGDGDAVRRILLEEQQQQEQDAEEVGGDGGVSWRGAAVASDDALTEGHLVAARALLQAGYRPTYSCCRAAAKAGSLPGLRWLLLEARPCPFGEYQDRVSLLHCWPVATSAEEEREAVEVLNQLVEVGCTGGSSLVDAAAERGSVPLLLEALRQVPANRNTVFLRCGRDKRLRAPRL